MVQFNRLRFYAAILLCGLAGEVAVNIFPAPLNYVAAIYFGACIGKALAPWIREGKTK